MNLPLGKYSPDVKIGFVSASRNCFPRELSETRTKKLMAELAKLNMKVVMPTGRCAIIESKEDAAMAAKQLNEAGCDAAVLYLGNFSPEIEDAFFVKKFNGQVMMIAAAEESAKTLMGKRGDALCGLLSASMGVKKRGLWNKVSIPNKPLVDYKEGAKAVVEFEKVVKVIKGVKNATIGLFGPRPRDFETCNYNVTSLLSIGVEVADLVLFDLQDEIKKVSQAKSQQLKDIQKDMLKLKGMYKDGFVDRVSSYEEALINLKERLNLSGASTQCWSHQEAACGHVPCFINARLNQQGFPVACENDAYSLVAELICQYASNEAVTMLDINHTIPQDLHPSLKKYAKEDLIGMFHCGNTAPKLLKNPKVAYQIIMHSLIEKGKSPDITRGTMEGQIKGSPITLFQIQGSGDKLKAYICKGEFLDIDPKTFGSTGTAYVKGFGRFYRNVLLGNFHHHVAVAFNDCASTIFESLKALGVEEIYTIQDGPYPNENIF